MPASTLSTRRASPARSSGESEFAWAQAMAELGPQIMIRPAAAETHADHYPALLAAAAGCHILADDRLDIPASFGAILLPNRAASWSAAKVSPMVPR